MMNGLLCVCLCVCVSSLLYETALPVLPDRDNWFTNRPVLHQHAADRWRRVPQLYLYSCVTPVMDKNHKIRPWITYNCMMLKLAGGDKDDVLLCVRSIWPGTVDFSSCDRESKNPLLFATEACLQWSSAPFKGTVCPKMTILIIYTPCLCRFKPVFFIHGTKGGKET